MYISNIKNFKLFLGDGFKILENSGINMQELFNSFKEEHISLDIVAIGDEHCSHQKESGDIDIDFQDITKLFDMISNIKSRDNSINSTKELEDVLGDSKSYFFNNSINSDKLFNRLSNNNGKSISIRDLIEEVRDVSYNEGHDDGVQQSYEREMEL